MLLPDRSGLRLRPESRLQRRRPQCGQSGTRWTSSAPAPHLLQCLAELRERLRCARVPEGQSGQTGPGDSSVVIADRAGTLSWRIGRLGGAGCTRSLTCDLWGLAAEQRKSGRRLLEPRRAGREDEVRCRRRPATSGLDRTLMANDHHGLRIGVCIDDERSGSAES